jgi:ElaA protein
VHRPVRARAGSREAEVGDEGCVLDSQEHLADFYRAFGFRPTGPAYDWDGVPHVPMRRDGR